MQLWVKFSSLFLLILLSSSCIAKTVIYNDVKDLNSVKEHLMKNNSAAKNSTLVIFDIDDTLLEAVNFVGSNKWYDWQRGKKVFNHQAELIQIHDHEKYSCMFSTLGTLFDLGTSKLTQNDAADLLKTLNDYDLMLLTSRTYNFRRATERELDLNGINLRDKHLLKQDNALDFNFHDQNRSDRVTYQNGLVMSSGLHKGLVLKEILAMLGKSYQTIYFVDDSKKNIDDMEEVWQKDDTTVNLFHYTRIDKSISKEEITQSNKAKFLFDSFLKTTYPDRSESFITNKCR